MINKRIFGFIEFSALIIWLSTGLFIRRLVSEPDMLYVLGFTPNFFAAIFLMFNYFRIENISKNKPFSYKLLLIPSLRAMALLFSGELLQKYLLDGVYDNLDLLASLVGVILSIIVFKFIERKTKSK